MSVASDRAVALCAHVRVDPESDAILTGFILGLLAPAEDLSLAAHGDGSMVTEAWRGITDPRYAPPKLLPHAGQYTGGTMPARLPGENDADYAARARVAIVRPSGMLAGTAQSIRDVVEPFLRTGHAPVRVVEGADGDAFFTVVLIRPEDAADPDAITAAVNDPTVAPAGVEIEVRFSDAPLVDEWTRTIDTTTAAIDDLTIADVT